MASPGSNSEKPDSSPLYPLSTPGWGSAVDNSQAWTPATTPSLFAQPHERQEQGHSNDKTLQHGVGHDRDIYRALLERRRVAEISRLGLDQTPSKPAKENEQTLGQPAQPGTEVIPSSSLSYWPSSSGNIRRVSPTYGALNLTEPPRAANWTSSPLIPISSLSTPCPTQDSFPTWQLPSSPWAVPPSTRVPRNIQGRRVSNALDKNESTDCGVALHHEDGNAQTPGDITDHSLLTDQQLHRNLLALASPSAVAPPGTPLTPWSWQHPLTIPTPGVTSPTLSTRTPAPEAQNPIQHQGLLVPFHHEQQPTPGTNHQGISQAAATATTISIPRDASSFYHPMNCRSAFHEPTQDEAHALLLKGFSPNYRGDPDLARNQSAAIPIEANCSLFLVGLAPDLTTHELLAGIRDVGRVYATHINPPAPERGHAFSAAKLVFFERKGAERFYARFATTGFHTPRHPQLRARVTWNRVRSAEVDKGGRRSRVLLVSGPRDIVEPRRLCAYLDTKMVYQLDEVVHRGASADGARVLLEIRFGSFRCQAEAARMALMREYREVGVMCEYVDSFKDGILVIEFWVWPDVLDCQPAKLWSRQYVVDRMTAKRERELEVFGIITELKWKWSLDVPHKMIAAENLRS